MSPGKVSVAVAESACGTGETGFAGSSRERDGMRGMTGGRHLVRTGAAPPFAVDGVVGDRMGVGRPMLARRWVSTMSENCADSKAGRRWKAPRSEVDGRWRRNNVRCTLCGVHDNFRHRTIVCITSKALVRVCYSRNEPVHLPTFGIAAGKPRTPTAQYAPGRTPPPPRVGLME